MAEPRIIDFQIIGEPNIGYMSIAEPFKNVPFEIKRVYWVYHTPEEVERGNHANYNTEHVIVCLTGKVTIDMENKQGKFYHFELSNPNQGLYIPSMHWRKLYMTKETVCLSLTSELFNEVDYIREYKEFKK